LWWGEDKGEGQGFSPHGKINVVVRFIGQCPMNWATTILYLPFVKGGLEAFKGRILLMMFIRDLIHREMKSYPNL